jgi:hypothetical protein
MARSRQSRVFTEQCWRIMIGGLFRIVTPIVRLGERAGAQPRGAHVVEGDVIRIVQRYGLATRQEPSATASPAPQFSSCGRRPRRNSPQPASREAFADGGPLLPCLKSGRRLVPRTRLRRKGRLPSGSSLVLRTVARVVETSHLVRHIPTFLTH